MLPAEDQRNDELKRIADALESIAGSLVKLVHPPIVVSEKFSDKETVLITEQAKYIFQP